jgi:hypothetical protein
MSIISSTENRSAISYAHPLSTGMAIPAHSDVHIMESYATADETQLGFPNTIALLNTSSDITQIRNTNVAKQELDSANASLVSSKKLADDLKKTADEATIIGNVLLKDSNSKLAAKKLAQEALESASRNVVDTNQAYSNAAAIAVVTNQTASNASTAAANAVRNFQNAQNDVKAALNASAIANKQLISAADVLEKAKVTSTDAKITNAITSTKATDDTKSALNAENSAQMFQMAKPSSFPVVNAHQIALTLRTTANESANISKQALSALNTATTNLTLAQEEYSKSSTLSTVTSTSLVAANKALEVAKEAMSIAATDETVATNANNVAKANLLRTRAALATASDIKAAKATLLSGAQHASSTSTTKYNDQMALVNQATNAAVKTHASLIKAQAIFNEKTTSYADVITTVINSQPIVNTLPSNTIPSNTIPANTIPVNTIPVINNLIETPDISLATFENAVVANTSQIKMLYWILLIVSLLVVTLVLI